MSYYYLAASLPSISMERSPHCTPDELRSTFESQLTPRDASAFAAVWEGAAETCDHSFVRRWVAADAQLRNAAVKLRAGRAGRDAQRFVREQDIFDTEIEQGVADAFARGTPLEREEALDRIRWRKLDELAGHDIFSSDAVLAYALQFQIATRWAQLDTEAGQATVNGLVARDSTTEEQNDE